MTEREPSADERAGMEWWNSLPESERALWLAKAHSAKPSDAWTAYKLNIGEYEEDNPPPDSWSEVFEALDKAGVPDDLFADRDRSLPQEREALRNLADYDDDAQQQEAAAPARREEKKTEQSGGAEQASKPPSPLLTTNRRGLVVKAKAGRVVTPELVKELSEEPRSNGNFGLDPHGAEQTPEKKEE